MAMYYLILPIINIPALCKMAIGIYETKYLDKV